MKRTFTLATGAYQVDYLESWQAYQDKISGWVEEAVTQDAKLLVFPEYAGQELASLEGADRQGSLAVVSEKLFTRSAQFLAQLSERHQVTILGGSAGTWTDEFQHPVNRAPLLIPGEAPKTVDKQIMTRWEREHWSVRRGKPLELFDTPVGKLGVVICYDAEFPLLARGLVEQGAEVLLAPSATETLHGYNRVRIGAMARALEGQCVVAHAPLVGAGFHEAIDMNRGAAAVYGPPDRGFPDNGELARGALDQAGWVFAQVDLDAIEAVRRDGGVLNYLHWDEQLGQ